MVNRLIDRIAVLLIFAVFVLTHPRIALSAEPKSLMAPFSKDEAKTAQRAWAKYLGKSIEEEIDLGGGVKMVFVLVPPGTFKMGSPQADLNLQEGFDQADESETPQHRVTISKPFYLGKFAVTQEQFVRVTGRENPSCFCSTGTGKTRVEGMNTRRFPVESVTCADADEFCTALQKSLGAGWTRARLPSEAMREYAGRAGTETRWHFGNHPSQNDGYFGQQGAGKPNRTREVGFGQPNSFGLYDMQGNVWEWCSDAPRAYTKEKQIDPEGPDTDQFRAFRGGAWAIPVGGCRSAYRGKVPPSFKNNDLGFRVVLVPTLPR